MKLSAWLEFKKAEVGLTKEKFARKIGVTIGAVVGYCNGSYVPSRQVMPRIKKVTRGAVTANDFYDDEPETAEDAA